MLNIIEPNDIGLNKENLSTKYILLFFDKAFKLFNTIFKAEYNNNDIENIDRNNDIENIDRNDNIENIDRIEYYFNNNNKVVKK
jgi:hypothetical protein